MPEPKSMVIRCFFQVYPPSMLIMGEMSITERSIHTREVS